EDITMQIHWIGLLAVVLWGCGVSGDSGDSRDVSELENRLASATERITVLEQELTRLTQIEDALASLEARLETTDGTPGDSQSLIDLAARVDEVEATADARATALEAKTAALSVEVFEGHPTLVVTGVNVHLRNGNGATDAT